MDFEGIFFIFPVLRLSSKTGIARDRPSRYGLGIRTNSEGQALVLTARKYAEKNARDRPSRYGSGIRRKREGQALAIRFRGYAEKNAGLKFLRISATL
ncbi:hypothetical protein C6495_00820 [Candidatus Poribacteria bacterium]|nr:MAG: hypothetical protein C6495_00820 [Candidatus Poribacteria bacterium]